MFLHESEIMSSFTKDKLKLELAKYKIPFPKDAKKDVYVKLYQTHVANKETSEYSSDEDMSDAVSFSLVCNCSRLSVNFRLCLSRTLRAGSPSSNVREVR